MVGFVRGCILFLALLVFGAGPSMATAKPLPKAYGYGRIPAMAAPVLDLRGLLPAGPNAELAPVGPPKLAPALPSVPAQPPTGSCYTAGGEDGLTASGEAYDGNALAAAHPNMRLSSLALVRNNENGKEVIVSVNDRPRSSAAIEFTPAAAQALGIADTCMAAVTVTVTRLGDAPYAAKDKLGAQQALNAPSPRSVPDGGAFLVQIGAFAQRDNAESAREQVATAGPVSVEPAVVGESSLFRVRLGPWATREEAEQARAAAAGLGFPNAKLLLP